MPFQVDVETNAGTIVTSASGAGIFAATKKKLLTFVHLDVVGWHAEVTSVSGQTVNFQLRGAGLSGGPLIGPTTAQTLGPGSITAWEVGT